MTKVKKRNMNSEDSSSDDMMSIRVNVVSDSSSEDTPVRKVYTTQLHTTRWVVSHLSSEDTTPPKKVYKQKVVISSDSSSDSSREDYVPTKVKLLRKHETVKDNTPASSITRFILINGVYVTEPTIVESDLVKISMEGTDVDGVPNIEIDWVNQKDIRRFIAFVSGRSKKRRRPSCDHKTYRLIDYFLLDERYLFTCYNSCSRIDKYKIRQYKSIKGIEIGLTKSDIKKLVKQDKGYTYKSMLEEADKSIILPIKDIDISAQIKSILPASIDHIDRCFIAGGAIYSLIRFGGLKFEESDIDIYCSTDSATLAVVNAITSSCKCITLEYENVINIFPHNSSVTIQVIRDDMSGDTHLMSAITSFDLDCCKVAYCNGVVYGTPGFQLCMMNSWCLDLSVPTQAYRVVKYKSRGVVITNSKQIPLMDDIPLLIELRLNKYISWRGESPERFLHLAKLIYGQEVKLFTYPLSNAKGTMRNYYDVSTETEGRQTSKIIWSNGLSYPSHNKLIKSVKVDTKHVYSGCIRINSAAEELDNYAVNAMKSISDEPGYNNSIEIRGKCFFGGIRISTNECTKYLKDQSRICDVIIDPCLRTVDGEGRCITFTCTYINILDKWK
jgi:hypothetical protein